MTPVIGIDFDNTIINYDTVFYNIALQGDMLQPGFKKNKRDIRDAIRLLEDGEKKWQSVQSMVYGERIDEAKPFPGVRHFLYQCKRYGIRKFIVSHKTEFSHDADSPINLRKPALAWMQANGLFDNNLLDLTAEDVFFESTRLEKIERISDLKCTHFIDDLQETFLETHFPRGVRKILFSTAKEPFGLNDVQCFNRWEEITAHFFKGRG